MMLYNLAYWFWMPARSYIGWSKNKIPLRIRLYFRVGFMLHLITALSIAGILFYMKYLIAHANDIPSNKIIYGWLLLLWGSSLPVFAQLDARSRFQNYKLLKDLLHRYGFQFRFVRALRHSRCQRDAALTAAGMLGYSVDLKKYYSRCGYRWFHLLPDFIFTAPLYLFTRHFWMTTFFTRSYLSKYYLS